ERPRERDRTRICTRNVLAPEDREQIGFALGRLRGRGRGGEADLGTDVILRRLEDGREVGACAIEITAAELRVPARVQRARLRRRRGDRHLERLGGRRVVVRRGLCPPEVQREERIFRRLRDERLQDLDRAVRLVRRDRAERLRTRDLPPTRLGRDRV